MFIFTESTTRNHIIYYTAATAGLQATAHVNIQKVAFFTHSQNQKPAAF